MSQLRKLFQRALDIQDISARREFLLRECSGNHDLMQQIESLIDASVRMGDFLTIPVLDSGEGVNKSARTSLDLDEIDVSNVLGDELEATIASPPSDLQTHPEKNGIELLESFLIESSQPGSMGRLGHYEIEKVLGQGAFGIVLAAQDSKLMRAVAIKVLHPNLATTSPPRKRFLREARAAAAIRHENIIRVYSVEEEPIPYLVMEYVTHGTMQDLIDNEGPIDLPDVVLYGSQLLEGLTAAHEAGIVHRDIKPSNLLIDLSSRPTLKITDFGLARTVDDAKLTQTGFVAGTPLYMSPEQALGRAVDAKSDLFSVGSVLYTAVTGRPPFRASTPLAVLKRVVEETPRPIQQIVPEVPDWICEFIAKIHEKCPENRFESTRRASEAWNKQERCNSPKTAEIPTPSLETAASLGKPRTAEGVALPIEKTVQRRGRQNEILWVVILLLAAILGWGIFANGRSFVGMFEKRGAETAEVSNEEGRSRGSLRESSGGSNERNPSIPPTVPSPPNQQDAPPTTPPAASTPLASREPITRGPWGNDAPPFAVCPCTPETAAELAQRWADFLLVPLEWQHPSGIQFRLIPPGEFDMGTDQNRVNELIPYAEALGGFGVECLQSETPRHRVTITHPFYLSIHEVSQRQYTEWMGMNPSYFQRDDTKPPLPDLPRDTGDFPVEQVAWLDACRFCNALCRSEDYKASYEVDEVNPLVRFDSMAYRLPTEAEWEYACLAGSAGPFATGSDTAALVGIANVGGRFNRTLPVGVLGANAWGIFDMHGNVNEWVQDVWSPDTYKAFSQSAAVDPKGPPVGDLRVTRGGDYFYPANESRAAGRFGAHKKWVPNYIVGFRVACSVMVKRGVAERFVRDTKVIRGADEKQFQEWIDSLGQEFIPHGINVRFGTMPHLIDALAIANVENTPWQTSIVADASEDFRKMSPTHRAKHRVPFFTDKDGNHKTIYVWTIDTPFWQCWYNNSLETIVQLANERRLEGLIPCSIHGLQWSGGEHWTLCKVAIPGAETRFSPSVTSQELSNLMKEYRTRNWRPIRLVQHATMDEPKFFVLFRDNPNQLEWEYSSEIKDSEFESLQKEQASKGLRPYQICSELNNGEVRYRMIWMQQE